jgi:hypothetical protein
MILPEEALRVRLVSALAMDRVATDYAEQGDVLPYVVLTTIDDDHAHHFTGSGGLVQARIQIDYFAGSFLEAQALAETGRLALDGFRGNITVGAGTFTVKQLHLDTDNTEFLRQEHANDSGIERVSHDYLVGYPEAVPVFS